jgi:hypothetical protein
MRTVAVRFSPAEHRLLANLAAAQGMTVETLVRDALTLAPIDAGGAPTPPLRVVPGVAPGEEARARANGRCDHLAPLG